MASKAQQALSANLAALSYALEMTKEAPGFNVRVAGGVRPGPIERRRQSEEIADPGDMSLELEPGKPLKNFGRQLAYSAGIPLPYNFRQSAEAAEQARINYANENELFGDIADTFLAQMQANADNASTESMRRQFTQYREQGANAVGMFFKQDASPQQRAAAMQQLTALNNEALKLSSAEAQDDAQQKRKVQLEQYVKSSNELLDVRSAVAQTGRSVENYNQGRQALSALKYDAPELQQFMRRAASDVLGSAGQGSSLGLGQINPALAIVDRLLSSEGRLLDPEVMDQLINTIGRSNIEHGEALLKGLGESNQKIISESPALRDMPSFGTIPFEFKTPATDAWWQQHSGDAPVQRDIIDVSSTKNTAYDALGAAGGKLGDAVGAVQEFLNPGVEMTDDAKRRAEEAMSQGLIPRRPTR